MRFLVVGLVPFVHPRHVAGDLRAGTVEQVHVEPVIRPPLRRIGQRAVVVVAGLVGERGPEILTSSAPGRILNNYQTKGAGGNSNLKVEVINRSSTPVTGRQGGTRFDGKGMVTQIILEDLQKGGPISAGMGGAYGLRRKV